MISAYGQEKGVEPSISVETFKAESKLESVSQPIVRQDATEKVSR